MWPVAGDAFIDRITERVGRWTASRTTRRSFLGRTGKVAMLVVSGPAVATLLAERAEARVCGQSGVSPKCSNFDCFDVWGWCWYARGCCADGGLKKICDCCAWNWPNVHGYCPSGTNVKCIVESCRNDPRVQVVELTRVQTEDLDLVAEATLPMRWPSGSRVVVLGDRTSPAWAGPAAPVATAVDAPLLLVPRAGLSDRMRGELRRLRAEKVVVAGGALPSALDDGLRAEGYEVERVSDALDPGPFSVDCAWWVRSVNGANQSVYVETSGVSAAATGIAAAYAAAQGSPLVVGATAAEKVAAGGAPPVAVGPEARARRAEVSAVGATASGSVAALSVELADWALSGGSYDPDTFALVPVTSGAAPAVAALRIPVLVHEPGTLAPLTDWLFSFEGRFGLADQVFLVGAVGALDNDSYTLLQSILNGFDIHRLIGVAGQGLPVIPQPLSERPLGQARVASYEGPGTDGEEPPDQPDYWTARASSR